MGIVRWVVAIVLAVFLIGIGAMKFAGAHIFQFIEAKATANGLPLADLFYPQINYAVGGAEIIAGLLILLPATRMLGGLLGAGVITGAIAFHLSPLVGMDYLGVVTPTGFADGAAAPWELNDFVPADPAEYSPMLFIVAVVMFFVALANLALSRRD
ncbi:MAG: hypothetical protein PVI23_16585 [Maricaulaceae bacterium]|jgi:hypothetical protein